MGSCLDPRSHTLPGKAGQNLGHSGMRQVLNFVGNTQARLIHLDHMSQVDRRGDQHQIAGNSIYRLFQFMTLHRAVAHCRKQAGEVSLALIGSSDRTDCIRARIDKFIGSALPRSHHSGAIGHFTMGERGAIFDDQNLASFN